MRKPLPELPDFKELRLYGDFASGVDKTEISVLFYPEKWWVTHINA
jgi:hypothetical protein